MFFTMLILLNPSVYDLDIESLPTIGCRNSDLVAKVNLMKFLVNFIMLAAAVAH